MLVEILVTPPDKKASENPVHIYKFDLKKDAVSSSYNLQVHSITYMFEEAASKCLKKHCL
jgi:hypothetical protein